MIHKIATISFPGPTNINQALTYITQVYRPAKSIFGHIETALGHYFYKDDFHSFLLHLKEPKIFDDFLPEEKQKALSLFMQCHQDLVDSYDNYGINATSIALEMGFLIGVGAIYRIVNLAQLRAKNYVNDTKIDPILKLLSYTAISLSGYMFMDYLGYTSFEFLLADVVKIVAQYLLPYVIGNSIKELDLISQTPTFDPKFYLSRNFLHTGRNLLTTFMLDMPLLLGTSYISSPFFDNFSGISIARIGNRLSTACVSNINVLPTRILAHEIGYMLGKTYIDLSIAVLSKIFPNIDLRDPFKLSNNSIGSYYKKKHEKLMREAEKRNLEAKERAENDNRNREVNYLTLQTAGILLDNEAYNVHSNFQDRGGSIRKRVKSPEKSQKSKISKKDEIRAQLDNSIETPRKEFRLESIEASICPLSYNHDTSIWGIVDKSSIKEIKYKRLFESSLKKSSRLKYIDKGGKSGNHVFELKCSEDARLLGVSVKGEKDVYNALKRIMSLEDAHKSMDKLAEQSGEYSLIVFNKFVSKHNRIQPTFQSM